MSRSTANQAMRRRCRRLGGTLGLVLLGLWGQAAEASPIRGFHITARGARDLNTWSSFLAGGSMLWSERAAPHISGAVHVAMAEALQTSNPRANPWVQYLVWRHDLNPRRFDYWHPVLGPVLEMLPPLKVITPRSLPIPKPQHIRVPPRTPHHHHPVTQHLVPPRHPTVPEPDALTVSLLLIGTGFWWRWRSDAASRARS